MNIVVLAKQIPDAEAHIDIGNDEKGLTIEQKFTANVFDEFAMEEALRLKEKHGGKVKVITLGAGKATEVLRTGIAMGADEVLLLEDGAFLNGDGYTTALALSRAAALEPFDVILCGRQAIDDDRGEVGPMVAQFLGIPHGGGITKLDVADGNATIECPVEGAKETIEVNLPAVFTAQKGLNEPRVPPIMGVMKAMKATIPRVTPADLGISPEEAGASGSKVKTGRYFHPKKRAAVQMIPGEPNEAAVEAVRILMDVERIL
ncbi:MAG: electron transfer flavoprotein subunit beta/FixA family protein [Syntrophorhabdaceae bacterium]|nr:electron transfer flavoprotein subunit beta/FixA family protein [Syntrophorhabdaceae bacterium]MDD5242691.1 electron transfer flavoprotein subunit beta/FixA family protein [Syntrophorhabdaceae bacterium]